MIYAGHDPEDYRHFVNDPEIRKMSKTLDDSSQWGDSNRTIAFSILFDKDLLDLLLKLSNQSDYRTTYSESTPHPT